MHRNVNKMETCPSEIEDLKDERVPQCLYWSTDQVADWIEKIGFPYYKSCIQTNRINGRKLILIEASTFPTIGITDFEHIKIIAKSIRDLLGVEEPEWIRSISLPPRSDIGMYLEKKSCTGKEVGKLTYEKFLIDTKDAKWKPPLTNQCLILPNS